MKLLSSFSTKTHPIHYVRSETHILGGFAPFGSSKCSFAKSVPGMLFWHEFGLTKLLSSFLAKTHPIHYFRSKTQILGGFAPFVSASAPLRNRFLGCRFGTSSGQQSIFRVSLPKRIQSTTLGPKLMFCVVSHHLVVASTPLPNLSLDAVLARVWADETIVVFFSQNASKLMFWVVSHHLVAASATLPNRF